MAYKWGLLTTYWSWDDPPSRVPAPHLSPRIASLYLHYSNPPGPGGLLLEDVEENFEEEETSPSEEIVTTSSSSS